MTTLNDSAKGLLLIFLAIICNYLGDTMNCSIQYAMFKHPIIKWLVVLGLIYFTINFTSSSNVNPSWLFLNSFIIFLVFILFMKQNKITFYVSLALLVVIFSINQYMNYYQNLEQNETNQNKVSKLKKTLLGLEIILIIILISGNLMYLYKQYNEHKADFNILSFYFGTNKCKSIAEQQQKIKK